MEYAERLEDLADDHGRLHSEVKTVDFIRINSEMESKFSEVARHLGVAPSTATRRYDRWIARQQTIAGPDV